MQQTAETSLSNAATNESERIRALEHELDAIRQKLANREQALAETSALLQATARQLESFRSFLPNSQIDEAQRALSRGDSSLADVLLARAEATGRQDAAKAAFQRGILAEDSIRFLDALEHYQRASELEPENALYANCAGVLAQMMGRYSDAKILHERALSHLESSDTLDPQLVPTLINLAGVRCNLANYDDAEAYLRRALVLSGKSGDLPIADAGLIQNNLGGIFKSKGMYYEATNMYFEALRVRLSAYRGSLHGRRLDISG